MAKTTAFNGRKVSLTELAAYQNYEVNGEVIGSLLHKPQLLKTYKVELDDFVESLYKTIIAAIKNLAREGVEVIDKEILENYLKVKAPVKYTNYIKGGGSQYVDAVIANAEVSNFKRNYDELKKWTLLRSLIQNGIDVSEYYDPNAEDDEKEEMYEKFDGASVSSILSEYKHKIVSLDSQFNTFSERESIRAGGEDAKRQKERWKETVKHGLAYSSNYLTTVTYGLQKGKYSVSSASSGTGKTRITASNIGHTFAPKYWSPETKKWEDNPNGTQNSCLYIGSEMKLRDEVEPILWAYMANVPEDHILLNRYEEGEEERVDQAIEILSNDSQNCGIYMEYIPNYDIATLEEVIKYHYEKHHITAVFLDYLHSTTALVAEYQRMTGGKMAIREDQVLGNLSMRLKEFTSQFDISLDTWTQVTGDFKNEANRDQTIVRGSKAIID